MLWSAARGHITRPGTLHGLCSREHNPCVKLREVLRLRYELKLGYQQIGRSCSIAVSTVHKYLKRAEATGVSVALAGRLG